VPLQVHYYSEAPPTQHWLCPNSGRSATGNCEWGFAQGPYVRARAGFERTTLRTKGDEYTNECPRPT